MSKKKSNTGTGRQSDINVMDREDHEIKKPKKYKAVMLNDDYTPMDFVMVILMQIFRKSGPESFKLMMDVHEKGNYVIKARATDEEGRTQPQTPWNFQMKHFDGIVPVDVEVV